MAKVFSAEIQQDFQYIIRATNGGTSYTNIDISSTIFDYFSDSAVVDDAIYFGKDCSEKYPWRNLILHVGTPVSATTFEIIWEYYGYVSGWTTIPNVVDCSDSFSSLGERHVIFKSFQDWNNIQINNRNSSWIRARVTVVTNITEGGAQSLQKAQCLKEPFEIDGGTELDPLTFADIHAGDLAGTAVLLTGYVTGNPTVFSMAQPMPCEEKEIKLDISCTARVGATCDIAGTDQDDNAITDLGIDISSGSATSSKRFKTVDANGITVSGMNAGDEFDVSQGRYGMFQKSSDTSYFLKWGGILMGQNDADSYLQEQGSHIEIGDFTGITRGRYPFTVYRGIANFGEIIDIATKSTKNGISIHCDYDNPYNIFGAIINQDFSGECNFYSCFLTIDSAFANNKQNCKGKRSWNCVGADGGYFQASDDEYNQINTRATFGKTYDELALGRTIISPSTYANYYAYDTASESRNCVYRDYTCFVRAVALTGNPVWRIVNPDYDDPDWNVSFVGMPTRTEPTIIETYSIDIHVINKTDVDLPGAIVQIRDKNGTLVLDEITDANGKIPQNDIDRGYYAPAFENTFKTYCPLVLTITSVPGYRDYEQVIFDFLAPQDRTIVMMALSELIEIPIDVSIGNPNIVVTVEEPNIVVEVDCG